MEMVTKKHFTLRNAKIKFLGRLIRKDGLENLNFTGQERQTKAGSHVPDELLFELIVDEGWGFGKGETLQGATWDSLSWRASINQVLKRNSTKKQ